MLGRPCCGMGNTMEQSAGANVHSRVFIWGREWYFATFWFFCCILLPHQKKKRSCFVKLVIATCVLGEEKQYCMWGWAAMEKREEEDVGSEA